MVLWKILSITRHPFSNEKNKDMIFYEITGTDGKSSIHEKGTIFKKNLQNLLFFFELEDPKDLCGKTFFSEYPSANQAIENFKTTLFGQVYNDIASAICQFKNLEIDAYEKKDILHIFANSWTKQGLKTNWLEFLNRQIHRISQGSIEIKIMQSGGEIFRLLFEPYILCELHVSQKKQKTFLLSPSLKPVLFMNS